MAFEEAIRALSIKAKAQAGILLTEEAAKAALIMPFINALGYDVFNPNEVIPEFVADVGVKKGEKVDYAIKRGDEFVLLIECKPVDTILNSSHMSQLYRYFSVTKSRFALLTNGIVYQFYTDLEEPNKLDQRPFLTFDIIDAKPQIAAEIKKFSKDLFNVDTILSTANTLKYVSALKSAVVAEFEAPSETMVKLFAQEVYSGRFTAQVREEFAGLIKIAYRELISDAVSQRLSTALAQTEAPTVPPVDTVVTPVLPDEDIVTTEDEKEGYYIVKSIARSVVDVSRIAIRDQKSYCAILVDDNNRRPLLRLHFNGKTKAISLFDAETEERVKIENIDDIYSYSDRIKATAQKYVK